MIVERLREAARALEGGDPEPFVALMAPDAEWRGTTTGFLWRRRTPS